MRELWKFLKGLVLVSVILVVVSIVFSIGALIYRGGEIAKPSQAALLVVDLKGMIIDAKKPLRDLRKYADDPHIKGVLLRVDSPGGVVGPSQELYQELKHIRESLKKPIVASGMSLMASGAYYAAVGADKIVVNPGTLVGSIGVIMEMANLEKLYDWAKIKRYSIKTGNYKDTGAEYRSMRPDEEKYLQETLNEVLDQFKAAVQDGRKLSPEKVSAVADGRIFNGKRAKELGLVDVLGTSSDAVRLLGQLTGLGNDPDLFEPPRERPSIMEFLAAAEEDDASTRLQRSVTQFLGADLLGRPLFLMPGVWTDRGRGEH